MNYLVNLDVSEEIDGRETDPLNCYPIYGFMELVLEAYLLILM